MKVMGHPGLTEVRDGVQHGKFNLVVDCGRPVSMNWVKDGRNHWSDVLAATNEWKAYGSQMMLMAREAGHPRRVDRFSVMVRQLSAGPLAWHQDIGNYYPSVKAFIDGMVLQKFTPDDTEDFLTGMAFAPCMVTGVEGLQFVIEWEIDLD